MIEGLAFVDFELIIPIRVTFFSCANFVSPLVLSLPYYHCKNNILDVPLDKN